jgi:gamma-glutamyl-gamma-aminobutyrate hydrolase PuuD
MPIWVETISEISGAELNDVSLIILAGGESLGVAPERDSFEFLLLQTALDHKTPVLGVCRGMQVMMGFHGMSPDELEGHAGTSHNLKGRLSGEVNSYHNFGFHSVPKGFDVVSSAPDGSIEAAYNKDSNWLGVMWHPEREERLDNAHSEQILQILGLQ